MLRFIPTFLLIGLCGARCLAVESTTPPPNIVLLYADDLGYGDLSSYGSSIITTPAIDSIGRDGVRFTRFYANASECTPSRAALLTGRYQQRVGGLECAIGLGNVGRYDEAQWLAERGELGLPAKETTIATKLRGAGYATGVFGKWHLGYDQEKFGPNVHGFDEAFVVEGGGSDYFTYTEPDGSRHLFHNGMAVDDEAGYFTNVIARRAIEWIGQQEGPFFAYVPFTAPHSPHQAPDDGPMEVPWKDGDIDTYRAMIECLDQRVGDILAAIARHPRGANTLVIFLSDNGAVGPGSNAPLKGWKGQMWEGGIRVPCLLRWPGVVPPNQESAQVMMNIDLAASLLAVAGVAPENERPLDGMDLRDVWTGRHDPIARTVFFRYKRHEKRRIAVMDGDWKFIIDNGDTWLLNLATDQAEAQNVADANPDRVAHYRQLLDDWQRQVVAPRLHDFSEAEFSTNPQGGDENSAGIRQLVR